MSEQEEVKAPEFEGGVTSTTCTVTFNGRPLGADVDVTLCATHTWPTPTDDITVAARQSQLTRELTNNALELVLDAVDAAKLILGTLPQGASQLAPVAQLNQGTQAGSQAPAGTGAPALRAVANGAASASDWGSVPSRFGDGQVRFLLTSVYSTEQMKQDVHAWIRSKGLDPELFEVYDERIGPKGAETAGAAVGSIANIKCVRSDEAKARVPKTFHTNAAGRVKFNDNGSLYCYWDKKFESLLELEEIASRMAPEE